MKKIFNGYFIGIVATIAISLVNYIIRLILTENLAIAEYGFFYSTFSLVFVIAMILDFGTGNMMTITIAKYSADNNQRSKKQISSAYYSILIFKIIGGILTGAVMFTFAPWIVTHCFNYPNGILPFRIMSVFLALFCLENYFLAVFWGFHSFLSGYFFNFCKYLLILIVLSFLSLKLWMLPTVFVLSSSLFCLSSFLYFLWRKKFFRRKSFIKLRIKNNLVSGLWLAFYTIGSQIIFYTDSLILTFIKGTYYVGLYNIALPIVQIFYFLLIVFPTIFSPIATRIWHRISPNKSQNIAQICSLFLTFTLLLFWAVMVIMIPCAKYIISFMFGEKFIIVSPSLTILSGGIILFIGSFFFMNAINAKQKNYATSKAIGAGILGNIVVSVVLIPLLGINGAALGAFSGYLVVFITSLVLLKKILPQIKFFNPENVLINALGIGLLLLIIYVQNLNCSIVFIGLTIFTPCASLGYSLYKLKHFLKTYPFEKN